MDRRLAAILIADAVGYSRLTHLDEEGTRSRFLDYLKSIFEPEIAKTNGRIVKTMGDGLLVEFHSVVSALRCAIAAKEGLAKANAILPENKQLRFRIGINLGDVIAEGEDVHGDGVNLADRLQGLADPGGIVLSGTAYDQVRNKLDVALESLGEQRVKNIDEPVRAYCVSRVTALTVPPVLKLPDKPSIAVLPFQNMSGDPTQEYFADGVVEDIITALSRLRWLFVIARNSSFTYRGRAVSVKQVGHELGVRYVLEGSVRRAGNRVRITAQLIEAATATHIWSERYDRDLADIFALQDEITESVVGAIEPELLRIEELRATRKSPESMDAWDHYMRGMWRFSQFSPDDVRQAEPLMRQAILIDPKLALGHIGLARVLALKILWGWSEDLDADRRAAYLSARRAVELDEKEAYSHYTLAWAHLLNGRPEAALMEAQKSIELTPNFALANYIVGVIQLFHGHFEQVYEPISRAMRLSPHEPQKFLFYNFLALAEYHQGRYEAALRTAQLGLAVRPFHWLYRICAACYGQLGRLPEAKVALADLDRALPKNSVHQWEITNPYVDPSHRAHFIEGMDKAGWTAPDEVAG
jgi:adenylate cyclase